MDWLIHEGWIFAILGAQSLLLAILSTKCWLLKRRVTALESGRDTAFRRLGKLNADITGLTKVVAEKPDRRRGAKKAPK